MPDNSTLTDDEVFDAFVRLPEESRGRLMSQFAAWNKSGSVSTAVDSTSESMLLTKIQDSSPDLDFQRYAYLRKKLDSESLTEDEHRELKAMIQQLENAHASRMKLVAQLSKLRSETLDDTMKSL
ncbi:MAG: hypothetical protein QF473_36505 [Planctomycetota bacterium]|jgi:hypothetical protein|nr:hypothetical protein [Planctomycetota bacterium]